MKWLWLRTWLILIALYGVYWWTDQESVAVGLYIFVGSWVGYSVGYHDGWHRYKLRVPILYRWLRTPEIEQHMREEEER